MERDPQTGEPTGIFVELGAQSLISPSIPLLTREEKKLALVMALEHFSRNGITSFTDAAIGPGGEKATYGVMSAEFVDIYKELLDSGRLTARATILLLLGDYGALTLADLQRHMETFKIPQGIDTTWLNFPGIKIFADGIPPSMTAWMNADYVGGGRGSLVIPGETDEAKCTSLKSMINYVHSKGRQIGVHATGDAAIDAVVDAFVEAAEQYGNQDLRHYVVHGDFISRQKAETLARYGFGLAMQPSIKAMIADFAPAFLGPERAAYQMPMAMAMDAGVVVTSSSDAPVTYPNWRKGRAFRPPCSARVPFPATLAAPTSVSPSSRPSEPTPSTAPGRTRWSTSKVPSKWANWPICASSTATSSLPSRTPSATSTC